MASSISMMSAALLLLVGLISQTHSQCLTGNDNPSTMRQDAAQLLSDARFDFALESLKKIAEIETQDNIFFSPHSLHEALGLAYFGSRGTTEAALRKALHVPQDFSKVDVQRFYAFEKSLEAARKANSSANYDYRVANRLWLSGAKKLRDCMLDFFGQELQRVDFKANPEAVRKQINDWVSEQTRGNIRDLLPASAVDESTDAVLANAVYFKGLWQSKFLPENTKRDVFYLGQDNMTIAQFMKQKGSFNHMVSEELGVHILQLPYKGDDVSMYILLPPFVSTQQVAQRAAASQPKSDGVRQLLQRLSDNSDSAKELRDILDNGMPARDVELAIPKFSLERELPVKDLLVAMDAGVVFDTSSDFTGFVADGEKGIHLGDAVHRAKIEVTEEGTTAAAATALFSFRSSRPTEPAFFTANHPFAYFIYDRPSRTVLFAGIFRKPNKK